MPPINAYRCDKCGFSLPSGWGRYMYVTDETGKRVICPHPNEFDTMRRVLGAEAPWELIEQRRGFNSFCLCLDCLSVLEIDLKRDARACSKCKSNHVASLRELIGKLCPKCKNGTFQEIVTGMWS